MTIEDGENLEREQTPEEIRALLLEFIKRNESIEHMEEMGTLLLTIGGRTMEIIPLRIIDEFGALEIGWENTVSEVNLGDIKNVKRIDKK